MTFINRYGLLFHFGYLKLAVFRMRFLRIDQCGALWLGLAEFLIFCQTQTTESFKVRIAISWKKQGRTPKKPHFFFIFDPEHNVYGPRNGSTEKKMTGSHIFYHL